VSLLLGQEARSDIPDLHGQMPLYLAAANGRIQVVSQLSKRQGLTATDDLKTCFYLAAKCGHRGAACILMKEVVFTNANGNNDFKTLEQIDGWQNDFTDIGRDVDLLVWAALNGIESMSNRFIGNGVKIQSYSLICDMTAMQAAAGSGHIEIVDLLLRKGAQVNAAATSINDRTALQAAAGGGHFDIVEMLNAAIA
jgi:ankyrin repeat protein